MNIYSSYDIQHYRSHSEINCLNTKYGYNKNTDLSIELYGFIFIGPANAIRSSYQSSEDL